MSSTEVWSAARNVLCVRLDSLGDVLMTTPALRALKAGTPGRRLTLLTSRSGRRAAEHVPELDGVLVYDAPWIKASAARPDAGLDRRMIRALRRRRFDAAIIFTVYSQNPLPAAMLCYLADIPLRLAHCRENPYRLLSDWVPESEPQHGIRHEVARQLALVRHVGAESPDSRLSLALPARVRARVQRLLRRHGVDAQRPWVVLHPGASAPSRRYPPENFAAVAAALARAHGWQVVFTGDAGERALVEDIRARAGAPSLSLAGRLDFGELAALIGLAPMLISNNTGPVHIAAALGTPVIDLYAQTNPQHTPWQVPHRVLFHDVPCKYCYKSVCPHGHHDCLRKLAPATIVAAALELARETAVTAVPARRGMRTYPVFMEDVSCTP
jgi:lipopolysaccharide heptosyltransferase II